MIRSLALCAACALALPAGAGEPQLVFVDDPTLGEFFDMSQGGQTLPLEPDGAAALPIGTFAGNFIFLPGPIAVGQNGGLGFGSDTVTDLAPDNAPIPSGSAFAGGQSALAFWDDIDDKEGDVSYVELIDDPVQGDRVIVQWTFPDFDGTGSTLEIQAHIIETLAVDGIFSQFMYRIVGPSAGAGASATIGYQDGATGYGDVEYSFDVAGAVGDGTVLSLVNASTVANPADIDGDGMTGVSDFLLLLTAWGACSPCAGCAADLDGDCTVGVDDFLFLLANWGV